MIFAAFLKSASVSYSVCLTPRGRLLLCTAFTIRIPGFSFVRFFNALQVSQVSESWSLGHFTWVSATFSEFWETLIYWATSKSFENLSFAAKNVWVLVKTWVFVGPEFWSKRTKKSLYTGMTENVEDPLQAHTFIVHDWQKKQIYIHVPCCLEPNHIPSLTNKRICKFNNESVHGYEENQVGDILEKLFSYLSSIFGCPDFEMTFHDCW